MVLLPEGKESLEHNFTLFLSKDVSYVPSTRGQKGVCSLLRQTPFSQDLALLSREVNFCPLASTLASILERVQLTLCHAGFEVLEAVVVKSSIFEDIEP
jgi:hypothetical protein